MAMVVRSLLASSAAAPATAPWIRSISHASRGSNHGSLFALDAWGVVELAMNLPPLLE
jgi:hypothetical protein